MGVRTRVMQYRRRTSHVRDGSLTEDIIVGSAFVNRSIRKVFLMNSSNDVGPSGLSVNTRILVDDTSTRYKAVALPLTDSVLRVVGARVVNVVNFYFV